MYCGQRSQYIRLKSKKNSFRGNHSRKYGMHIYIASGKSTPWSQYDEPDINKKQKSRPKTPIASKVIPLGFRITIVWNPTSSQPFLRPLEPWPKAPRGLTPTCPAPETTRSHIGQPRRPPVLNCFSISHLGTLTCWSSKISVLEKFSLICPSWWFLTPKVWPLILWVSLVRTFDFYLNLAHHTVGRWKAKEQTFDLKKILSFFFSDLYLKTTVIYMRLQSSLQIQIYINRSQLGFLHV